MYIKRNLTTSCFQLWPYGSEGDKVAVASPVIFSKFCHPRHQSWSIIETMVLKATFFWNTPVGKCLCPD